MQENLENVVYVVENNFLSLARSTVCHPMVIKFCLDFNYFVTLLKCFDPIPYFVSSLSQGITQTEYYRTFFCFPTRLHCIVVYLLDFLRFLKDNFFYHNPFLEWKKVSSKFMLFKPTIWSLNWPYLNVLWQFRFFHRL